MSLSTRSSTGSPYAAVNSGSSGGGVLRAIEEAPGKIAAGVEDAIAFPFEMVGDIAMGAEHAVEGGVHLLANGVNAVVDGVGSAAHGAASAMHAVTVDLPVAVASDVSDVAKAALDSAGTVATAAAGITMLTGTSPIKLIGAIL